MRIANLYSHLNGYEFLLVHKPDLWDEIADTIMAIDANQYIKLSKQKTKMNKPLYDQKLINDEFENILMPQGWESFETPYYVCEDIDTARIIAGVREKEVQRQIILDRGFQPLHTKNQVDFLKDRVAVEVQFGKYFSVAYDLHVKHTFFFLRNDIDVGIEIIPTRNMCLRMDTGVAWFENEVANVIREGRSNPTVPIVMIGIEPERFEI